MSIKAMHWCWQQDLSGADKLMLLALGDTANDDGVCWPGQAALAKKCSVNQRAARYTLARLEAGGFIYREKRRRANGSHTSDLISLSYHRQSTANGNTPPSLRQATAGPEPSVTKNQQQQRRRQRST